MSTGKHPLKPKPIKLGRYATAYANRPPTKRLEHWSWKMQMNGGKSASISLGRLPINQVLSAMKATCQERAPLQYAEQAKRQTFENLMEQWYLDVVAPRAPEAPIRAEYKLSKRTVLNYRNTKKQLALLAPNLLLDDLNPQRVQELVSALQRKYAPRTVQLHITTLRQILSWAWKKQKIAVELTVISRRPKGDRGYVNNRHTPTDEDVAQLLSTMRMCALKKMVYIGWKTGARTGEICDLQWKDIYKDRSGCWIRFAGKTGTRRCPIEQSVYEEILGFKERGAQPTQRLFKVSYRSNCSAQLRRSCELRGIEPFTIYGLRRLRVDVLQRQGIEPAVYEQIMGHSMRIAQEIYRTTNAQDLQNVLRKEAEPSNSGASEELLTGLIGRLGLSLEEALLKLMGS